MEFVKRNIKLFILSGKARSGKDTVANFIKDYYKDKKTIILSFGHYIKDYAKRVSDWDGEDDNKPRELLQQIGIELIKNKINNRLFINRILDDIEIFSYFYDVIIVDDARLRDEIEAFKEAHKNCVTVRVIRNNYDDNLTNSERNHVTEIDLDNYTKFDYTIINNNTFDELRYTVEKMLKEVK